MLITERLIKNRALCSMADRQTLTEIPQKDRHFTIDRFHSFLLNSTAVLLITFCKSLPQSFKGFPSSLLYSSKQVSYNYCIVLIHCETLMSKLIKKGKLRLHFA